MLRLLHLALLLVAVATSDAFGHRSGRGVLGMFGRGPSQGGPPHPFGPLEGGVSRFGRAEGQIGEEQLQEILEVLMKPTISDSERVEILRDLLSECGGGGGGGVSGGSGHRLGGRVGASHTRSGRWWHRGGGEDGDDGFPFPTDGGRDGMSSGDSDSDSFDVGDGEEGGRGGRRFGRLRAVGGRAKEVSRRRTVTRKSGRSPTTRGRSKKTTRRVVIRRGTARNGRSSSGSNRGKTTRRVAKVKRTSRRGRTGGNAGGSNGKTTRRRSVVKVKRTSRRGRTGGNAGGSNGGRRTKKCFGKGLCSSSARNGNRCEDKCESWKPKSGEQLDDHSCDTGFCCCFYD